MEIPKYIEGVDPGFQELSVENFVDESAENNQLREETISNIKAQYKRLNLTEQQIESVENFKGISFSLSPIWNLKMHLDWLSRVDRR